MPVERDDERTPHLITWNADAVGSTDDVVGVHARYGDSESIVPRDNVPNIGSIYWHVPADWHGEVHFQIHGPKGVEEGTILIP